MDASGRVSGLTEDPAAEFLAEHRLTEAALAQLDLTGRRILLSACARAAVQVGYDNTSGVPHLTEVVLQRAVEQHREGKPGLGYPVAVYQELRLLTAESREELLAALDDTTLAEITSGEAVTADTVAELFDRWTTRRAAVVLGERRQAALDSTAAQQLRAAAPPDFAVTASPSDTPGIKYYSVDPMGSVDELLADLRRYFVPTPEGPSGMEHQPSEGAPANPDLAAALVALSAGEQARDMQHLETNIRAWARPRAAEAPRGGNTSVGPGYYNTAVFDGTHIFVDRDADGGYTLRLNGGGDETGLTERFAAVVDRRLAHGGLAVSYASLPRRDVARYPLVPAPHWQLDAPWAYLLELPVEQIVRHLAAMPGAHVDPQRVADQLAGDTPQPSDTGPPVAAVALRQGQDGGVSAYLPTATVQVLPTDPTQHDQLAAALLALYPEQRSTQHLAGELAGHSFTFAPEVAEGIAERIGQQETPAVVSSRWPRRQGYNPNGGFEILETFAPATEPGRLVVCYLGAGDPSGSAEAARAVFASWVAEAEAGAAPVAALPSIVVLGHPNRDDPDRAVSASDLAQQLRLILFDTQCGRSRPNRSSSLPPNTVLFAQNPEDVALLAAAVPLVATDMTEVPALQALAAGVRQAGSIEAAVAADPAPLPEQPPVPRAPTASGAVPATPGRPSGLPASGARPGGGSLRSDGPGGIRR
ncbi:MAG: hypothetical protein ACRDPW_05205 [Mycobacteriales bacterium]